MSRQSIEDYLIQQSMPVASVNEVITMVDDYVDDKEFNGYHEGREGVECYETHCYGDCDK